MDAIKRDIYVLRDTIQYRIEVTRGTNMIPIELTIRDFNIPTTATAVAYAFSSRNDEPSKMMCDIVENTIKFTPSGVFFETGLNQLMIRIINDGKRLISFEVPVWCKDNKIRESDKSEEDQQTLIEQLLEKNGNLTDQVDKERKRIDNLVAPGKSAIGLAKKQLTKDANKLSQTEGSHTHSTSWTSTGSDDDATFLASVKDKNVFVLDCFCRTHSSKTNTWGNTYHEAEAAITINGDTVSVNATYKTTDTNTDAAIFTVVLGYDEDSREIADLRVDSDGVTHNSAGAAVRAQTKDVPAMRDCLQSPYVDIDLLELGNINKSTGAEEDSTKILRSERFRWNADGRITAPTGYTIAVATYTVSSSGTETFQAGSWIGYVGVIGKMDADGDKHVRRLLIKRSDGADINVEDLRGKITTNVSDLRAMDVLDKMQEEIENVQVDTDTTLTKEGAPADAKETGDRITKTENCLKSPYVDIDFLELGDINKDTGAEGASTKVLRSKKFRYDKDFSVTVPDGYLLASVGYDVIESDSGTKETYRSEFWYDYFKGQNNFKKGSGTNIVARRLLIKRSDGADINKADLQGKIETDLETLQAMDAIKNLQEKQIETDPTLENEGMAADAAETGRRISLLENDTNDIVTKNIARVDNLISEGTQGATAVKNDDGSIVVTPEKAWGRYDFRYKLPNNGAKRIYYLSVNFTKEDTNIKEQVSLYLYDSNNKNLQIPTTRVRSNSRNGISYDYCVIFEYKEEAQYEATQIDIGVMTNTDVPYTITKESMVLIDVTELAATIDDYSELLSICQSYYYGTDYKEQYTFSDNAKTADSAKIADNAKTADSTNALIAVKPEYTEHIKVANSYFGYVHWSECSKEKKYLYVIQGSKEDLSNIAGAPIGFINNTGTWGTSPGGTTLNDTTTYSVIAASENDRLNDLRISMRNNTSIIEVDLKIYDVTDIETVDNTYVTNLLNTPEEISYNELLEIVDKKIQESKSESEMAMNSTWKGKNALVIGDSITAAQKWQKKLNTLLGMNVTTHAKGGVGTIAMVDGDKGLGGDYDNETSASGTLKPLSVADVQDKDLIIVLPAYNDRGKADGTVGDCYNPDGSGQQTIAGIVQYTINRIYEILKEADNLTCKVLYATPHCAGRYPYIDADGYDEYPSGTGRTMETLANTIVAVCNHANIPVCDLWHNSGINKFTWNVFGHSSNAINENYSPYKLDSSGNPVNKNRIRYTKGESYYQIRDGEVVLEEYTGSQPFPYNGDQLHCSNEGYARIGECIVGAIISHYGN